MERRRSTAYTAAPFSGGSTPISILGLSIYCLWTIYRIWTDPCRQTYCIAVSPCDGTEVSNIQQHVFWDDLTAMKAPRTSRNGLAYSTMWTFKSSVIWAFMARLAVIGLTYAQPFLIMALTNYVQESEPNKNEGYGLIGAFSLVFLLKGVSFGNPFKSCIISNILFAGLQLSLPTS